MSDLLNCPFCGAGAPDVSIGATQDDGSKEWSVICSRCGSSCSLHCLSEIDAAEQWNRRATTTPAQQAIDAWHEGNTLPPVERGHEREFIAAVRRAHSGKIYSFAASYLNAAPLRYDYCPKDKDGFCEECSDDGCPTTGWFVQTGDDDGTQYNGLHMDKGDEFMGWREIPRWEDRRADHAPISEGMRGTPDRDKIWQTIAKHIACEADCQKWPNGCGCAQNAADAVLSLTAARDTEGKDADLESIYGALSQAQDCIRGETPEDVSDEAAREDTIAKVRDAMRTIERMQSSSVSSTHSLKQEG